MSKFWTMPNSFFFFFQMKPNGFVVCRVAILMCSFISSVLTVTDDGECCCLQSITDVNECLLAEYFEMTKSLSETQA